MGPGDTFGHISDALARRLKRTVDVEIDPKSEPKKNPLGSNWIHQRDLGKTAVLVWGRVVEGYARANVYKVKIENSCEVMCELGGMTGFQPFGAKQLNTLPPGTAVWVLLHPTSKLAGTIICTEPDYITHPGQRREDFITQTSRCGPSVDKCHSAPYLLAKNGGIPQFSGGRPADGLMVGEWGAVTETGLRFFLDPFMAQVAVDEETGLFAWYRDQLVRLAGHNLQIRSVMSELEQLNNRNELTSIYGASVYLKEALGGFDVGNVVDDSLVEPTVSRNYSLKQTHYDVPEYANIEPAYDDQQPFRRWIKFESGYLGQGFQEILCIPPADIGPDEVNRYSVDRKFIGVYEQRASIHGGWSVTSAKDITISKRPCLMVPKQRKRPEDLNADTPDNYQSAGYYGDGPEHTEVNGPLRNESEDVNIPQHLIATSAILDQGAFDRTASKNQFYRHPEEWYLPEECEGEETCIQLPQFCLLRECQFLSPPAPVTYDVDHRYAASGGVSFYPTESLFKMLDDGSILIGDAYGSGIVLGAGNIELSAPGDIWMRPGRNFNVWSGWDTILRSLNSCDISTTRKDIRLKAENNLQMLSGNNGCGGTLIESKAICPVFNFTETEGEAVVMSGVTIQTPHSHFLVNAQKATIRTRAGEGPDAGGEGEGDIVLDAGSRKIRSYADFMERFIRHAAFDFFVDDDEATVSANEWWGNASHIGSYLHVHGPIVTEDGITCDGWIKVSNGHIATELSGSYGGLVSSLAGADLTAADADIAIGSDRHLELIGIGDVEYFGDGLAAAADVASNIGFSFRTRDQYRVYTNKWMLFESRWQQLARLNSDTFSTWTETPVGYAMIQTYPYPGRELMAEESTWKTIDPNLYNVSSGCAAIHGSNPSDGNDYDDAHFSLVDSDILDGNYPVIMDH